MVRRVPKGVALHKDPAVVKSVLDVLGAIGEQGFGGKLIVSVYPEEEGPVAVDLNATMSIPRVALTAEEEESLQEMAARDEGDPPSTEGSVGGGESAGEKVDLDATQRATTSPLLRPPTK